LELPEFDETNIKEAVTYEEIKPLVISATSPQQIHALYLSLKPTLL